MVMFQMTDLNFELIQIKPNIFIIDFECFFGVSDEIKEQRLQHILLSTKDTDIIIGHSRYDNLDPTVWAPWVTKVIGLRSNIFLILDNVYKQRINFDCPILWIDFYVMRVNYELSFLKSSKQNKHWNPDANKFLFLTGKPYKLNRAYLLYRILQSNLKNHCTWSFFLDNKVRESTRQIVGVAEEEFERFVDLALQTPDGVTPWSADKHYHYGGIPYDHTMYKMHSFRLISESQFEDIYPWKGGPAQHTEKTWLTIANNHPFIMADSCGSLDILKSKGFDTFEHCLPNPYDTVQDPYQRIDAILENVAYWLTSITNHKKAIRKGIATNAKVFSSLIIKNENNFEKFFAKLGLTLADFYSCGFFSDPVDKPWIYFYNNIKDPSWPQCYRKQDFYKLPDYIQKECINVFQYRP